MKSRFITVEGLDGSGKTTVISQIVKYLNIYGIKTVLTTSEPGGTPIANVLRMLIKYGLYNESISDISELLMIYAARFQLLENIIKPALLQNQWVISDRHDLSSQAYQGGGRQVNPTLLGILSDLISQNIIPDLTFYLDITPEISASRVQIRRISDRIEQESLDFFYRVHSRYQHLAKLKNNVIFIDATQSLKIIIPIIIQYIERLVK